MRRERRGIRRIWRVGVGFEVGLRTETKGDRCLQSFSERRRRRTPWWRSCCCC